MTFSIDDEHIIARPSMDNGGHNAFSDHVKWQNETSLSFHLSIDDNLEIYCGPHDDEMIVGCCM